MFFYYNNFIISIIYYKRTESEKGFSAFLFITIESSQSLLSIVEK